MKDGRVQNGGQNGKNGVKNNVNGKDGKKGFGNLRENDADKNERLFHQLAPPLNSKQRFLVVISLLSDIARSLLVS